MDETGLAISHLWQYGEGVDSAANGLRLFHIADVHIPEICGARLLLGSSKQLVETLAIAKGHRAESIEILVENQHLVIARL